MEYKTSFREHQTHLQANLNNQTYDDKITLFAETFQIIQNLSGKYDEIFPLLNQAYSLLPFIHQFPNEFLWKNDIYSILFSLFQSNHIEISKLVVKLIGSLILTAEQEKDAFMKSDPTTFFTKALQTEETRYDAINQLLLLTDKSPNISKFFISTLVFPMIIDFADEYALYATASQFIPDLLILLENFIFYGDSGTIKPYIQKIISLFNLLTEMSYFISIADTCFETAFYLCKRGFVNDVYSSSLFSLSFSHLTKCPCDQTNSNCAQLLTFFLKEGSHSAAVLSQINFISFGQIETRHCSHDVQLEICRLIAELCGSDVNTIGRCKYLFGLMQSVLEAGKAHPKIMIARAFWNIIMKGNQEQRAFVLQNVNHIDLTGIVSDDSSLVLETVFPAIELVIKEAIASNNSEYLENIQDFKDFVSEMAEDENEVLATKAAEILDLF